MSPVTSISLGSSESCGAIGKIGLEDGNELGEKENADE